MNERKVKGELIALLAVASAVCLSACGSGKLKVSQSPATPQGAENPKTAALRLSQMLAADERKYGSFSLPAADDSFKLGVIYHKQGRLQDAEAMLNHAVQSYKTNGAPPLTLARALNAYGLALIDRGEFGAAEAVLQESLSLRDLNHASDSELAESQNGLGELYYQGGILPEAERQFRGAINSTRKSSGVNSIDFAEAQNNLAGILVARHQFDQAELIFKSSLSIYTDALGHDQPEVASCLNNLAEVYRMQGKCPQAEPLYKEAIAIYEKVSGPDDANLSACYNNLALLYQAQHAGDKAEPLFQQSIALAEKTYGSNSRHLAASLQNYAAFLREKGRDSQSRQLSSRAQAILATKTQS
jgi:tetratricopeptide (TPR) repeat protein